MYTKISTLGVKHCDGNKNQCAMVTKVALLTHYTVSPLLECEFPKDETWSYLCCGPWASTEPATQQPIKAGPIVLRGGKEQKVSPRSLSWVLRLKGSCH